MEKNNDMILNMLANPKFEARDFQSVGLTSANTNLLSEEEYLKSDKILKNPEFLDKDGNFDKEKFHQVYNQAGIMYNQLAHDDYQKTVMESALFSEDNIWAKPEKRLISYKPKLTRSPNENLVTSSLDGVGKRGQRTKSTSEIAQTLKVYNVETQQWEEAPNDDFFGHFFDTLVLATYDEDVFDEETGQKIHNKGDKKLNNDGLPYYETLGGRNPHDKQILNKMNTFTKDGSFANKFDFFDSDDIEQKSLGGTLLKNAALVGSMFIPYVGPYVTAASVLTQTLGLAGTLGKLMAGSDSPTFNNLQGWAKSVGRQTSTEYAQQNTWCGENLLNMVGDTIGQLAEQRWIFKAGPTLMTGSTKPFKALSDKGRQKLIEQTAKEMQEAGSGATLENLMKTLSTKEGQARLAKEGWEAQIKKLNDINASLAATKVDNMLEKAMKVSAPLSKVYMTGITVQDTYDEAKAAGASDMEAALLTLGYASAEMALLNTEVGEWIMPELHGDRFKREAIAEALANNIMPVKEAETVSKVGWVQNILKLGRDIANRKYSKALMTGGKTGKVIGAHALGESFEEVSEEVLADLSKSIFNVTRWLRGEDALDMGQWDNMADRYAMSAIGGFIGGGLNSAATDFATAKNLQNMNRTQALQELLYMINNGKEKDFLKTVDQMTLGDKNLSGDALNNDTDAFKNNGPWKAAQSVEDSQDFQIKKAIKNQVAVLKSILESEGAKLSTDSLVSTLTLENQQAIMKDMRLSGLKNATSLGLYLQGFQDLLDEMVAVKSELMQLEDSKPDSGDYDQQTKDRMALLNQRLLKIREDKNAYMSGKKSGEFVRDALFEMNPALSSFMIKANEALFLEDFWGKKIDEMSDAEKEYGMKTFEKYSQTSMKNDIHRAAQTFHNMITNASALVQQQSELLKQQAQDAQGVIDGNNYLQSILDAANIDAQHADVDLESAMGAIQTKLQNRSRELMQIQALPYLPQSTLDVMLDLLRQANTVIDGESETDFKKRQKNLVNKYLETMWEGMADNLDAIMQPLMKQPYLNPELKNGLKTQVSRIRQYFGKKKQDLGQLVFMANGGDANALAELNAKGYADVTEALKAVKDAIDKEHILLDYLSSLDLKTNSPIIDFISQFLKTTTNSDLDMGKHWENTIKMFEESGEDPNEIMVEDSWVEDNKEALRLVDAFQAVLQGMRVDNADYNNPTGYTKILNKVNSAIGNTEEEPLAEIDQHEADLMLQDLNTMKSRLELAQTISDINRGQKLKVQEKVATRKNFLLYKHLSQLGDIAPEDWIKDGKAKDSFERLKAAIDSAEFLKTNFKEDNLQFSKEERSKAEKEMLDIEDALYDWFDANKSSDGTFDKKKLGGLLRAIGGTDGFFADNGELLTEGSKSIDANSYIWWLAARAAVKGSDFYSAYRDSATKEKAPIASQELATYLGVAAITNMNVLNSFVDAYRDTVISDFKALTPEERRKVTTTAEGDTYPEELLDYFGGSDWLPQYKNMIFIEGAPGTGKSKGVIHNIKRIAATINPDILKNAWYAHVTEDSAQEAIDSIGLEGGKAFNKEGLMNKIVKNHQELKPEILKINRGKDSSGKDIIEEVKGTKLKAGSYGFNSEGQLVNTLELLKYSSDELPNVIFIDEVSHYNEQELSAIEQFAAENQIVVITAGDLQQNTQVAYADIPGKKENVGTSITRNKFIRSVPLGVSLRSRNKPIDDSMAVIKSLFKDLKEGKKAHDVKTYYAENVEGKPGLYGVKTIKSADQDDVSDDALELAKKSIDIMMSTLKDGEKIGYITDYSGSKLAKYLEDKYKGKYELYSGSQAQGREGQYYIVENDRKLSDSKTSALQYLRSLYTGVSRAEQGVLLITSSASNSNLGEISSVETTDLQLTNLGPEAIERQYEIRKEQLNKALEDKNPEPIKWEKPTQRLTTSPTAPTGPSAPVSTPTGTITPSPLPPALPGTPSIPRRIGTAYTDEEVLKAIVGRLRSRIPDDTKVKNTAGEEFTFKDIITKEVGTDSATGASLFEPMVVLEDKDGAEVQETLSNFKANYTPYTPTAVVPVYSDGEQITLTSGENIEILSTDVTDPNNPQYIIKNIDTGDERTITQAELQGLYKEQYIPATQSQPEQITQTGLENLQGEEYQLAVTAANIDVEPAIDTEAEHILHKLYTFNAFELGMHDDGRDNAVFDNPGNDPAVTEKFKKRIDNLIGLSKLLGTTKYSDLVTKLAVLKNDMYDIESNSDLAAKVADELGLTGTTTVRYAFKSSAGRVDTSDPKLAKYGIYDMVPETEQMPYMFSDDEHADIPLRKKLVMVVNNNGKNVLEVTAGTLNSPLTLITNLDDEGNLVYANEWATFRKHLDDHPRDYFGAAKAVIDNHPSEHPDLIDLFKLWLFTSNGIFYMDPDWNLASMQSTGPQLDKQRGEHMWEHEYDPKKLAFHLDIPHEDFTSRLINIAEFAEHPQRVVSSVMMSTTGMIGDQKIQGLNPGHSFVLVANSNTFKKGDDAAMLQYWIQQQQNPNLKKKVKLVYVVPPSASVGDWLMNLHNVYTNKLSEGSKYKTMESLYDIGNDFTAFRVIEAMIDNGKFDELRALDKSGNPGIIESSDGTKENVKQAIQELKDIETKWQGTLNLNNSNIIDGRGEKDYYEWLLSEGYSEKEARRHMATLEQKAKLDKIVHWNNPATAGKTLSQALSSYLTNLIWHKDIFNQMIEDPRIVNSRIKAVEDAAKGRMDQVFYKAQYSDEKVYGDFIKVQTKNKYDLGKTPFSKQDAAFKINGKIDTPVFFLKDFHKMVKEIADSVYFSSRGSWTYRGRFKDEEDMYLEGTSSNPAPASKTLAQTIRSEYARQLPYLNQSIIDSNAYTTKQEMLEALAKDYNTKPRQYGFVYNGKLYLTKHNFTFNNPEVRVNSTENIEIKNATDNNGKLCDLVLTIDPDPSNPSTIKEVAINEVSYYNVIKMPTLDTITQQDFDEMKKLKEDPMWEFVSEAMLINLNFDGTLEDFRNSIMTGWFYDNGVRVEGLDIQNTLEPSNISQATIDKLIDFYTAVPPTMNVDDIVLTPNRSTAYKIISVTTNPATGLLEYLCQHVVKDANGIYEDAVDSEGEIEEAAALDVNNMLKEDTDCHKIKLQVL